VCAVLSSAASADAQRVLGLDISAWQGSISQTTWNNFKNTENRGFVFLRSSRGGTTGYFHNGDNLLTDKQVSLSQRYDDPYFGQNITRAVNAGMFAGPYHFSRPDVVETTANSGGIANTGTDEANHFIQMAGAWMRPGYLVPIHDFEAGDGIRSDIEMVQFALDFSNRIYDVMGIRPGIYMSGNYAQYVAGGGTAAQRSQLAQQSSSPPSVVSPAYPTLWSARWPNQTNPNSIDAQNLDPTVGFSNIYGPWDDYGVTHPWAFWQYASTGRLQSFKNGGSNLDFDVAHGDVEYLKDQLVPALWMSNASGDWSTLANWNSGQMPVAPILAPNQSPVQGTYSLPTPRLPGAAGSGVTSGQNDTVILERPNANITVTVSTGAHNIRKLYMREALNITGGSLTVNYNPHYVADNVTYPNSARSGPISAQFSGPVSMSGGSLSVHTLQVDANETLTLSGGTLTVNTLDLMPLGSTPAKLIVNGDVAINPLNNAAAVIQKGAGTGNTAVMDLGGGMRTVTVGNGAAAVDLTVSIPVANGGLTKAGPGTLALTNANSYSGNTEVQAGTLSLSLPSLGNAADVLLSTGATLDLGFTSTDSVHALFIDGVSQPAGTWGGIASDAPLKTPLITGTGKLFVAAFVGTPLAGDFNEDGIVDSSDLAVWSANYGLSEGAAHIQGDANGDSMVDGSDYQIWQSQLSRPPASATVSAPVPEPSTVLMVVVAGLGLSTRNRRSHLRRPAVGATS
jgi:autotransporter-associated beta strand protein